MLSGEQRVRAGGARREGREKSFPAGCDISAKPCRTSYSAKLLKEVLENTPARRKSSRRAGILSVTALSFVLKQFLGHNRHPIQSVVPRIV